MKKWGKRVSFLPFLFNQQQMNNINQQLQEHMMAKAIENVAVPVAETTDDESEYLSREETSCLLHIDKSTLHRWTNLNYS